MKRNGIVVCWCILTSGLFLCAGGHADPVDLISPNSSLPAVVAGETQTDREAAEDLCNYLSRVSNRTVVVSQDPGEAKVVIHVGRDLFTRANAPQIDDLFADGFIIKGVTQDDRFHLILAGKMLSSSQAAVERFLKDFVGVHWLFPDPVYGEIVPSREVIALDRDVHKIVEPDYVSRTNVGMYYYFNPSRLYLRGGPVGYDYGQHAIQFMFTEPEFKAHPEWFAFFNGKRNWWAYGNGWQICTTNPETVRHAVGYVLRKFGENPLAPMVSIGNNDGWGECECSNCSAFLNSANPPYTVSERWWTWVNQVAREVKKTHPDKWVESLAYAQTSEPPRFKLEENVAITKTIVLDREIELARKWAKVCKSVNLYSYMYGRSFLGFRHYPRAARDFLKWGHDELGARAHVTEGGGDWTFDGPKYHYLQAIQWDVDVDIDSLMDEFCTLSYGKAAGPMREFWDRLEEVYERRKPAPHGKTNRRWLFYQWVGWATSSYLMPNDELQDYTSADVEFLDDCISRAQDLAASDNEGSLFRVQRMNDAWRFFRTAVVSFTKFYDIDPPVKIGTQVQFDTAMDQIQEIARLRAERTTMLRAIRSYPAINPRASDSYFWALNAALTVFSHESRLLDETCFAMTGFLLKNGSSKSAVEFWEQRVQDDELEEAAETQIYVLCQSKPDDRMVNGDFETGDLNSWEVVDGSVTIVETDGAVGRFAAQMVGSESVSLSQKIAVTPMERYRLSSRVKYMETPPGPAVPVEAEIEFYAGEVRIWEVEPTRSILRTTSSSAGWLPLVSTVTVPPGANTAVVRFRCSFSKPVLWDQVRFERIRSGVDIDSGEMADAFDAQALDESKWFQTPASPGVRPPQTKDGWLVYDCREVFPLTSFMSFNHLLDFRGSDRYRLRFRVARAGAPSVDSILDWSIQAGTSPIRTQITGMYWTHSFAGTNRPVAQLYAYASQGAQNTYAVNHTLEHLSDAAEECWYTLEFDPEFVTVYVSTGEFNTSEGSRVAHYAHGITDPEESGDLHLKIQGRFCKISDISLLSNAPAAAKASNRATGPLQKESPDLTMPGVTDK